MQYSKVKTWTSVTKINNTSLSRFSFNFSFFCFFFLQDVKSSVSKLKSPTMWRYIKNREEVRCKSRYLSENYNLTMKKRNHSHIATSRSSTLHLCHWNIFFFLLLLHCGRPPTRDWWGIRTSKKTYWKTSLPNKINNIQYRMQRGCTQIQILSSTFHYLKLTASFSFGVLFDILFYGYLGQTYTLNKPGVRRVYIQQCTYAIMQLCNCAWLTREMWIFETEKKTISQPPKQTEEEEEKNKNKELNICI